MTLMSKTIRTVTGGRKKLHLNKGIGKNLTRSLGSTKMAFCADIYAGEVDVRHDN